MAVMSLRERAARAVYRLRPFRTAMSTTSLVDGVEQHRLFDFDEAPAYYVQGCYEIAEAVLATVNRARSPVVRRTEIPVAQQRAGIVD